MAFAAFLSSRNLLQSLTISFLYIDVFGIVTALYPSVIAFLDYATQSSFAP